VEALPLGDFPVEEEAVRGSFRLFIRRWMVGLITTVLQEGFHGHQEGMFLEKTEDLEELYAISLLVLWVQDHLLRALVRIQGFLEEIGLYRRYSARLREGTGLGLLMLVMALKDCDSYGDFCAKIYWSFEFEIGG